MISKDQTLQQNRKTRQTFLHYPKDKGLVYPGNGEK